MFFFYSQNNSGGGFHKIGYGIIVEADDAKQANYIAEEKGLYFNGVEDERDCPCCGDRWYRAYGKGDLEPSVYGKTHDPQGELYESWELQVPIFYKDGRTEYFKTKKE